MAGGDVSNTEVGVARNTKMSLEPAVVVGNFLGDIAAGIGAAIAAVLGLIVVSLRPSSQAPEQRTVTVARGDVTATVTARLG